MKPLGIRKLRFPGKTDCHPRNGYVNWWEVEFDGGRTNKAREKRLVKKEIEIERDEYI